MSERGKAVGPLLVVTALADEARAFFGGTDGSLTLRRRRTTGRGSPSETGRGEIVWVGPGSSGDSLLLSLLTSGRFSCVLFTGLAGALSPGLSPGSTVVAEEVVTPTGARLFPDRPFPLDLSCLSSIGERGEVRVFSGRILSSAALVGTPEEKEVRARETGAMAVDMESAGWLALASRAGVPAAVVRVISDGAEETLPPEILSFVASDGSVSYRGILRSLLSRPALLSQLLTLWPSLGRGRTTLTRMGGAVSAALRRSGQ